MERREVEDYLRRNVPLSEAMGVAVVSAKSAGVRLSAPFALNRGQHDRIFGGNAAALAIMAGWATVYASLKDAGIEAAVVTQDSTIEYRKAIGGDIEVFCPKPVDREWQRFLETLQRFGKSRIELGAVIECHDQPAVQFIGRFVAFGDRPEPKE